MRPKAPKHNRIKEKLGPPNAEDLRFWAWLREQPCQVCKRFGVSIHHQPFKSRSGASHRRVVGLCPECHQHGPAAIHGLGSDELFNEAHGVDIQALADSNWTRYERP